MPRRARFRHCWIADPMSRHTGPLFVAPALVALALLIVYPILYTGVLSFTNDTGTFVGLANFRTMASSRVTSVAVRNTAYFVGVSIVFQIGLGTLVGILLNQRFLARGLVRG